MASTNSNGKLSYNRSTLVPIYQTKQCCQYGSQNVRLLYGTKSIRKIGQNSWRYSQSKIPVPPGREVIRK